MPITTPRTNRTTGKPVAQPGDMTALRKQAQEETRDVEQAEAAQRLTMAREVDDYEKQHVTVDYTGADVALPDVEEDDGADERPYREIIVKYDIDKMAFGRDIVTPAVTDEATGVMSVPPVLGGIRFFDFKEGRRYRVPRELAEHLDERGYVFH